MDMILPAVEAGAFSSLWFQVSQVMLDGRTQSE